jgi:ribonuclease G
MNKEMIISSGAHDTRVAILEDDQVVEVFIERERQRGVVGNIYKGRVSKVLPGMQSSFVDIGLERDAFLYVTEVVPAAEEFDRLESGDEDEEAAVQAAPLPEAVEAVVESVESPAALPADVTPAPATPEERPRGREASASSRGPSRADRDRDRPQAKIEDLLKEGQEVLVQVVKEPLGTKGARLTSHVTMPGRFLVFMPTVDHVGVSRKIDSREERARLRGIVKEFREQHGFTGGVIIRTAASGRSKEDIVSDLAYFHQVWTEIRQKMETARRPPVLLFQEQSLVTKLIRDLLTDDYTAIRLDSAQEHRRVVALVERIMPSLVPRVKLYTKDYPIFEEYGVQAEIDKALRSKVWLKSGGYLVINQTEALVAIDVNTGRYVGKRTGRLEDTILKTNLEAVKEIVRQLRLRDLGGIIVLDLIDMEEKKNRQKVFQEVERELRRDRSPSKAIQVSDFGLVIVTRKRVKQSIERQLTDPCPYCSGSGSIKSASTICYEILMEMKKIAPDLDGQGVLLRVNPDIARALKEEESAVLRELQQLLGRPVTLKPDSHLHHEQFDLMAI